MIATLLECEIICDGEIISLEHIVSGYKLVCVDGSTAELRHLKDLGGEPLWALDVWDDSGVLTVAANTRKTADMISIDSEVGDSMIYALLEVVICTLRYGWWTYAVVAWDEGEGLKLVHREHADAHHVVCDIRVVRGRRYDDEEGVR